MKIVSGISRWTNASRGNAIHIDDGHGRPLCGEQRKVFSWVQDEGEPTCRACKKIKKLDD